MSALPYEVYFFFFLSYVCEKNCAEGSWSMQVIASAGGPNYLLFKQQVIVEIYNITYSNQSTFWAFLSTGRFKKMKPMSKQGPSFWNTLYTNAVPAWIVLEFFILEGFSCISRNYPWVIGGGTTLCCAGFKQMTADHSLTVVLVSCSLPPYSNGSDSASHGAGQQARSGQLGV